MISREHQTRIDPLTGETEQRCARCGEWWFLTSEFFYRQGKGFNPTCKACYEEARTRPPRKHAPKIRSARLPAVRKGIQLDRNWQRKRHGMECTAVMFEVLQCLLDAEYDDVPYILLPGIHKRTLNSLTTRGWIKASLPGLDGIRFAITSEGKRAHRIFAKPAKRLDGICPTCGVRPKHVSSNGRQYGYCKECESDYKKAMYHLGRQRIDPDRLCSCCHQRPLHRMSGGKLSTYCTECRHAKRAEERRLRVERELARVKAGEVLLCRMCKQRPRAHTENYVRAYCPECQRIYMADYNDRRRPDSQAAKQRKG